MRRRDFMALLGGAAVAWPLAARGQQPPAKSRLGIVSPSPRTIDLWVAFDERMRELGYAEGQNLAVEFIHTGDEPGRNTEAIRELMQRKIDIFCLGGEELILKAALALTTTLPIVTVIVSYDPVERGYAASIARPGGNFTGIYLRRPELVEKQMELLAQTFPDKRRLGVLWDAYTTDMFGAAARAAQSLRLELRPVKLEKPPYDFVAAFRRLAQDEAQMLLVLSSIYFNRDRPHIAALALQRRLPSMFQGRTYTEAGGLLSYGPSIVAMYRRAADYVDRIARGTKPADLPIEQPTKFELVINLKTARALGLEVPPTLLAVADEVIE